MSHQTTSNDHVILDVTEEEHQEQINAGFSPESTFKTGKHVGRRGGFANRHGSSQGDLKPSNAKVKITMWVDGDVLDFFKSRRIEPKHGALSNPNEQCFTNICRIQWKGVNIGGTVP